MTNGARCRRSLRAILRHGPAQWHTARCRAYFTARTVARHSGDVCDQVPMVPLSGTPRAAEPILPHARSPVTPGTFATRFRWLGVGVQTWRWANIRRWKKLWYFAIVSELFVKIRFLCGKSDFLGLSVWFFVSRGWHLCIFDKWSCKQTWFIWLDDWALKPDCFHDNFI